MDMGSFTRFKENRCASMGMSRFLRLPPRKAECGHHLGNGSGVGGFVDLGGTDKNLGRKRNAEFLSC